MTQLVESVPNVSEGRNERVIQEFTALLEAMPNVALLNRHVDLDHHRSVFTLVGEMDAMHQALFRLVEKASELIDLRIHSGQHPRIGAVDVVPWIPLQNVTMAECVEASRRLGERVGSELGIPVFLYEQSCRYPERRALETIRRGGLAGLEQRMDLHPAWIPDFGPTRIHPTAGAMVTGARFFLIAFNIMLESQDIGAAQAIARTVRTSGGGYPALKAIGIPMPSHGCVQVSMNLTDFRLTSLRTAYSAVEREAARLHIEVRESELVGMIPRDAWDEGIAKDLKLKDWQDSKGVLETVCNVCNQKDLFRA